MKVNRLHCSKCNSIIVCSEIVTHNTYASHIGEGCEVLVGIQFSCRSFLYCCGLVNLFTVDEICILYDTNFLSGYFADNTDSKSRSWEWLTEYQFSGIPSSRPALRTSSLKRSRSGSMISLKSTKSGSPPTLW